MKTLKIPNPRYQIHYEKLLSLFGTYDSLGRGCINVSGSLQSYIKSFKDRRDELIIKHKEVNILFSNKPY